MQQIEKYKIISTLEKGNYAESYRVQAKDSRDILTLKIAKEGNPELNGLIAREFTILSQFKHRNIVKVFDYGVTKANRSYFVGEFISGMPLNRYFKGYSEELVRAMLQILDALIQMHNYDFVHSDLKPEHIIYDPKAKRAVLIDFGFASIKTDLLMPRGTFGYMAPEVLKGLNVDQRSDLYSLGVILSQIVFPHKTENDRFSNYDVRKSTSLFGIDGRIPKELHEVICSILADEPALRPTTGAIYEIFIKLLPEKETTKPNIKITLPQLTFIDISHITHNLADVDNVMGNSYVIFGDKGIGKTRLLNELRYKYLLSGCDVFVFSAAKTHRLFNVINDYVALRTKPEDAEDESFVFNELVESLKNKTKNINRSLAILIDDLDELESFDRSFARFLGFSIKDSKIVVIATSEYSSEIEEMGFNHFCLRSFGENELKQLVESTFKVVSEAKFSNWLYAATDGNPLFVDETIKLLYQKNLLYYEENKWRLRTAEFAKFSYSKKIEDIIHHKIERLENSYVKILQILSLYNNPMEPVILSEITGIQSLDKLEYLRQKELIKVAQVKGRLAYVVASTITSAIINRDIQAGKRRSLYKQFLRIIKKRFNDVPEYFPYVAEFASACNDIKDAYEYCLKAAEIREAVCDFEGGIRFLKKATEYAEDVAPGKLSNLLIRIGKLKNRLGKTNAALSAYLDALKLTKNALEYTEIYYNIGLIYQKRGKYDDSTEYFNKAISSAQKRNSDYANIMNSLSYNLICLGQVNEAHKLLEESFYIAKSAGQNDLIIKVLYNKAVLEWFRQDYDKGVAIIDEALGVTRSINNPYLRAKCFNLLASFYQQKGDFCKSLEIYNRAISLLELSSNINALIGAMINTALMFMSLGKLEKAIHSLNSAMNYAKRIGRATTTSRILDNLAKAHRIKGDFHKALELSKQAMDMDPTAANPVYHRARLLCIRGEITRAERLLTVALRVSDNPLYHLAYALINAYYGKIDLAELNVEEGIKKSASGSVEFFGKTECFLDALEFYYGTKQYDKCRLYATQALSFLPPYSRECIIVDAILQMCNFITDGSNALNIDTNLNNLTEMGCLYDWAYIKRMEIEALCERETPGSIISNIDELFKAEEIVNRLGAKIEYDRIQRIKDLILNRAKQITMKETHMTNYLDVFHQISDIINNSLGEDDFIERILDILISVTKTQRGALFLFDGERTMLAAGRNMDKHTIDDARKMSRSVAREARKGKGLICCSDVMTDVRFKNARSVLLNQIRSIACAPLTVGKKVIGVIYLDSREVCNLFTVREENLLLAVANFVASTVEKSKLFRKIMDENISMKAGIFFEYGDEYLLGESQIIKKIRQKIEKVAKTDATVLITGETGCGKGMVARLIHQNSLRRIRRFVSVNCGCLPETLFESELFGYKKGAFTGACTDKKGLFEEANAGTMFLDEISNAPISTQGKLLEAIEDKKIRRLGETIERKVDVRLISATNRDLHQMIAEGVFREDLFYRIGVLTIHVPPLKERPVDIPILANHLLKKFNSQMNRNIIGFEKKAFKMMLQYSWPGNVRELQNAIERAVIFAGGEYISLTDLEIKSEAPLYSRKALADEERIIGAIKASKGNILLASKVLGISRRTLYRYIKKYDIKVADYY